MARLPREPFLGSPPEVKPGDPNMSEQARAALAELVEVARRHFESRPDRAEIKARQAASRQRIRERNERLLRRTGCD